MNIIIPEKFKGEDSAYGQGNSFKRRYTRMTVPSGEGAGTYVLQDGMATSKVKEIADALKIEYKPTWFAHQIAKKVLEQVLGDKFIKPKRGANGCTLNAAIFDGFMLVHDYDNDGLGMSNSIQVGCYVYSKV
ncbi:MAG: hypothetical protein K2M09_02390 [Muribaculaceae bacterium]|nr:hypothetical protein [Muribaculaceae bacterium]MDE6427518.1 hypothetical protein [Muribaculaceae bacterium]